jgi:hypothetical protein
MSSRSHVGVWRDMFCDFQKLPISRAGAEGNFACASLMVGENLRFALMRSAKHDHS